MTNQLFQQAVNSVKLAKEAANTNQAASAVMKAKNALSSAYANSTVAEQMQLHELQNELDTLV